MSKTLIRSVGDVGENLWRRLPRPVRDGSQGQTLGNVIHALSRRFSSRGQSESTWFLRNEPLLSAILEIISAGFGPGDPVRICSVACSTGAELYSVLWTVRKARPDLDVTAIGFDLSAAALERARHGCYLRHDWEFRGPLHEDTLHDLFDADGQNLQVKDWVRKGIQWTCADACDAKIPSILGLHDVVLANNFLIHMKPGQATAVLANVARLVKPGGILVCRGVDLDVRQRVVSRLHLEPVPTRIEQIHEADWDLDARCFWPWKYFGLEPLNKNRKDWVQRYSSVFRVPDKG
jgi:chemotaxis protein methyltransferase CheR